MTGCGDGGVRLWDIERRAVLREWKHEGVVYSVAVHPTGRRVISSSFDHTAKVWDVETGDCLDTFRHMTLVSQAAFRGDRHIVTTAVGIAQLWSMDDQRPISPVFPHGGTLWGLAISPDGNSIVTGSDDKTVRVWNAQSGIQTGVFYHDGQVRAVAISPDGMTVASASVDGTVRTWPVPLAKNPQRHKKIAHRNQINSKSFSPDGRQLLTASLDRTAAIWETKSGQLVRSFLHDDGVSVATFSPDASIVLTVTTGGKVVRLFDASTGKPMGEFEHNRPVSASPFRPGSTQFATGCADGFVRVWDSADGQLVATMKHGGEPFVSYSLDGRFLASWRTDKIARIWQADDGEPIATLQHDEVVNWLAWSPDGTMVATASDDATACVWAIPSGEPVFPPLSHPKASHFVEFNTDGRLLLTTSTDKRARIWTVPDGRLLREIPHTRDVTATLQPHGRLLLTGDSEGLSGQCQLWDFRTGLRIGPPIPLEWGAAGTFSPDGSRVLYHSAASVAFLASVPQPVEGDSPLVTQWVETLTRKQLAPDDTIHLLDEAAIAERHERLKTGSAGRLRFDGSTVGALSRDRQ